jgi:hypothetical protein
MGGCIVLWERRSSAARSVRSAPVRSHRGRRCRRKNGPSRLSHSRRTERDGGRGRADGPPGHAVDAALATVATVGVQQAVAGRSAIGEKRGPTRAGGRSHSRSEDPRLDDRIHDRKTRGWTIAFTIGRPEAGAVRVALPTPMSGGRSLLVLSPGLDRAAVGFARLLLSSRRLASRGRLATSRSRETNLGTRPAAWHASQDTTAQP